MYLLILRVTLVPVLFFDKARCLVEQKAYYFA